VIDLAAQGLETAVRVHGHTTRDLVLMAGALACAVAKLPHLAVLSGRQQCGVSVGKRFGA
jgi:hypothetical protein